MQSLIPVINKLQDVFSKAGIMNKFSLPQIVVVGSQSAGKSSVLEHVVGKDFLPRGANMVTKRPLIIQCVKSETSKEYATFQHTGEKKFYDFEKVKKEIQDETDRTCPGNSISPDPIRLRIFSPNVVDLTLVDLPGVVKVSTHSQKSDIVEKIREMVYTFIRPENALILAISAANVDLANSDALSMAKEVDPKGERTVGIITKIDIMDRGTDCMDVLTGKVYPLKLGYIGIVNRCQEDINKGVTVKESLKKENEFFKNHPKYGSIAHRMGTEYMVGNLHQLLVNHIKKNMPSLKNLIKDNLRKSQERYNQIKPEDDDPNTTALKLITLFVKAFESSINGTNANMTLNELQGGAKIFNYFQEIFRPSIDKQDILSKIKDIDILTAIKNASGIRPCLYVPQTAFENLISKQVKSFESICHECVDKIYDEMKDIIDKIANDNIQKYPKFKEMVIIRSTDLMNACLSRTHDMVQDLIEIEADYVNTSHPDFDSNKVLQEADDIVLKEVPKENKNQGRPQPTQPQHQQQRAPTQQKKSNFINNNPRPVQQQQPTESIGQITIDHNNQREMREIQLIRNLCKDYLVIVRKTIKDLVPKTIVHLLVFKTRGELNSYLLSNFLNKQETEELFEEDPAIVNERKMLKENIKALEEALKIISTSFI